MEALNGLRRPSECGVTLNLKTLTPLYTGGIGQHGEELHPSGLLGSVRRFSCLLAAAVGDADFETTVWGETGRAKRVALRWNTAGLRTVNLPSVVNWTRADHQPRPGGWRYNVAHDGPLTLTLTRRGINDKNDERWRLLLLALRIQVRHAAFGAKDQHGLGVLAGDLPKVGPLDQIGDPLDCPGLHRAFFAEVRFDCACPSGWEPAGSHA